TRVDDDAAQVHGSRAGSRRFAAAKSVARVGHTRARDVVARSRPSRSAVTPASSLVAFDLVPEPISRNTVAKVARLARLDLTEAEVDRMTDQLAGMLEHFRDVDALDLSNVQPLNQPIPLTNVLRDDVEQPSLDRDEVLGNAPAAQDGRFRVPPIIGFEE
ncbi:MAG: aspartyl/glutamyl-tRNA(Asn/Gln) amidotransferase subunit, partial [Actinomycetota bacterium]